MSAPQKFRSAFNGFNREDVVRYLEYINNKHNSEINRLTSEADFLRSKLESVRPDAAQAEAYAALEQERDELRTQVEALQARLEAATGEADSVSAVPVVCGPAEELEAYRRAERTERMARERSELMYHQANNVITEASVRINDLAAQITPMADQTLAQITRLQEAVLSSKQALQDAAVIVSTLRPNN